MVTRLTDKIWQILILTPLQLLGSFVIALTVFLIEFSPLLLNAFEAGGEVTPGETGKTVSQHVLYFVKGIESFSLAKDIVLVVFWGGVAVVIYLLFLAISNAIISIRNEYIVDTQYNKDSASKTLVTHFGNKLLAAFWFAVLLGVSIAFLIPYLMDMLKIFAGNPGSLSSFPYLFAGLIGLALNIYIVWASAYFTWIYEESV